MKEEPEIKKQSLCVIMREYMCGDEPHAEPWVIVLTEEMAKDYVGSLNIQRDKIKNFIREDGSPYKNQGCVFIELIPEKLVEPITWNGRIESNTEFYIFETKVFP